MSLKDLVKKLEDKAGIETAGDVDKVLRQMFKEVVQEMLQGEMTQQLGYEKYERNEGDNARNGKSSKTLKTSLGNVDIDVPRDRKSEFDPKVIKKHQTVREELEDKIISMYAKGMTLRDINSHLEEIYGVEISPTQLSEITDKVLPLVTEWQARPLDRVYPIVYLDAIHYKVKDDSRIVSKAAYVCLGINQEGHKDLLGMWIGENEGAKFWLSVCNDLKNRGVEDILIACIDGLKGFPDAIKMVFPQTEIQLCIVHQIRNSTRYVSWKDKKEFMKDLKPVYQAATEELALQKLDELESKWEDKYQAVVQSWKINWRNLSSYFKYPPEIRKVIYTTNPLEGLHRQYRKVTKSKAIFPSDQALQKMLFLASRDVMKKWVIPVRNWSLCISQLAVFFEGRLDLNKISL